MSSRPKVTIVGAGATGATCAEVLAQRDYAEIVLTDIKENLPQGKALDINQMAPILGFEATHGSAPKYKGQNKVNPTAMILSGKLMLEHLGEDDAAARLERAVASVISEGERVTYDLKPSRDDPTAVGTSEYADAIIEKLEAS